MLLNRIWNMFLITLAFGLTVSFNACDGPGTAGNREVATSSSISLDCPQAPDEFRNPTEFQHMIDLINVLPKPLSLECFLANFDPPMNLLAVNSVSSAQPAEGPEQPRILIVRDQFIVTIVPTSNTNPLVEFSRVIGSNRSVKGELQFPISDSIAETAAFDRIRTTFNGQPGTSCRFCHKNEVEQPDGSIASDIVDPLPSQIIKANYMQSILENCDEQSTPNKCRILKAVYGRGPVSDIYWPF
ncbi:MAG: hypothetical protein R2827_00250 [Bdellovibrionales bacterium]